MKNLKPVIVLAFGNDNKSQLAGVAKEAEAILEILDGFEGCEVVNRPFTRPHTLLKVLEKYENRIVLLHFAGHSDNTVWKLDGGSVYAKGLAKFLKHQNSIRLLFLNGCKNKAQVAAFTKAGVPAIIATSRPIEDSLAGTFACHFYKSLISQEGNVSVQEAYEKAKAKVEVETGEDFRSLDVSNLHKASSTSNKKKGQKGRTREMHKVDLEEQGWAWGLYYKESTEVTWKLRDVVNDPLLGIPLLPKRDLPEKPFKYINWFREKDAEIFFGRNQDIGSFYRLITDEDSAPITLLYGQSGVGKSSFLAAGVLPRLKAGEYQVYYVRRNQEKGALETLYDELELQGSLKDRWQKLENTKNKPLMVILDQLEEVFTYPLQDSDISGHEGVNSQLAKKELEEFTQALLDTFAQLKKRPKGKLILAFRKEWLAEIENTLKEKGLPLNKRLLKPLYRDNIKEAVAGIAKVPRLQNHYNLSFVEGEDLPTIIADDLLVDADSALAPTLQILLTKMWQEALAENESEPQFTEELYERLRKEGYLLNDFLKQQIKTMREWQSDVVDSGLLLDILYFHTTPLSISATHTFIELKQNYSNHAENYLSELIKKATDFYLLIESKDRRQNINIQLLHDTLAPLVRKQFEESDLPGQRAKRILESRKVDWIKKVDTEEGGEDTKSIKVKNDRSILNKTDLKTIYKGKLGMRNWDELEEDIVLYSRKQLEREEMLLSFLGCCLGVASFYGLLRFLTSDIADGKYALEGATFFTLAILLGAGLGSGFLWNYFITSKKEKSFHWKFFDTRILVGALGFTLAVFLMSLIYDRSFRLDIMLYRYLEETFFILLASFPIGLILCKLIYSKQKGVIRVTISLVAAITLVMVANWFSYINIPEERGLPFTWSKDSYCRPNSTATYCSFISYIDAFLATLTIAAGALSGIQIAISTTRLEGLEITKAK